MMRRLRPLRQLAGDSSGVSLLEFAFVAPVFLTMIIGIFDVGQLVSVRALVNGAVEEAARSNSLESGDTDASETQIAETIAPLAPNATVEATYSSYFDFADIDRPEQIDDENGNGECDEGETYTDENNNDQWDEDVGVSGNGGANDVVLFNVTVTFDRVFKIPFVPGDDTYTVTASSVKKNQPYAFQEEYSTTAKTCTA